MSVCVNYGDSRSFAATHWQCTEVSNTIQIIRCQYLGRSQIMLFWLRMMAFKAKFTCYVRIQISHCALLRTSDCSTFFTLYCCGYTTCGSTELSRTSASIVAQIQKFPIMRNNGHGESSVDLLAVSL